LNREVIFLLNKIIELPGFNMELKNGINTFYARSRAHWRKWLKKNHLSEKSVWLIMYKKESGTPSVYYPEAVEEALCFGWIDSKPNKRDSKSYYQYFAKRNPRSKWSRINKYKIEKLTAAGLMAPAGLEMVAIAKKTGTWTALDEVENLLVPGDLQKAFDKSKKAFRHWSKFPPSVKKGILDWIGSAKTKATRIKRITETVRLAGENSRANQYIKE
jgi:uncharacterized protein YdeI (YjbR/CyaY-like superfamily)